MKKLLFLVAISLRIVLSTAQPLVIIDSKSKWNDTVSRCRDTTIYIIVHTVEGRYPGCMTWMHDHLHTMLLVTREGLIIRLADEDRLINHAGYSMWDFDTAIWRISVGIEFEGYHDQPFTDAQKHIGGLLIDSLKHKYHIVDDDHVFPHSMIACTRDYCFAGRKRGCAQELARDDVRREFGLHPLSFNYDPRVINGQIGWPNTKVSRKLQMKLYGCVHSEKVVRHVQDSLFKTRICEVINYVPYRRIAALEYHVSGDPLFPRTIEKRQQKELVLTDGGGGLTRLFRQKPNR